MAFHLTRRTLLWTTSTLSCSIRAPARHEIHHGCARTNPIRNLKQRPATVGSSRTRISTFRRRYASTSNASASGPSRIRLLIYTSATIVAFGGVYLYFTDARSAAHRFLTPRVIRFLLPDAEDAHHFGTSSLATLYKFGLNPRDRSSTDPATSDIAVEVFGHLLDNPVGISAGLDKNADVPSPLLALGPGVVEVGGVTPQPQEGNDRPRVFRVPSQDAMINRYGLNSAGADAVARNLLRRVREFTQAKGLGVDEAVVQSVLDGAEGVPPGSLQSGRLLAIQIAKNKSTSETDIEAVKRDYVYCVERLAPYADLLVVNVSSPNTPGLRSLQRVEPLTDLLRAVVSAASKTARKSPPPVMVKVSPDEDSDEQVRGIIEAVFKSGVHGIVVGNTTNRRPPPSSMDAADVKTLNEPGGYSGPWLFDHTRSLVGRYRRGLDAYQSNGNVNESIKRQPLAPLPEPARAAPALSTSQASIPATSSTTDTPIEEESIEMKLMRTTPSEKELKRRSQNTPRSQPLFRLPDRHSFFTSKTSTKEEIAALPGPRDLVPSVDPIANSNTRPNPKPSTQTRTLKIRPSASSTGRKVIFASGGITTGQQLEAVLDAGADVGMLYTAMTYGGVGTVARVKDELRAVRGVNP